MKVLKDPNHVLHILDAKLDELHKRLTETDGKEATEIGGQESSIIRIALHIRHVINYHGYFGVEDMEWVREYVDDAKEEANEYHCNPRGTWFAKGLAKGAAWVCVGLEARMEEEP